MPKKNGLPDSLLNILLVLGLVFITFRGFFLVAGIIESVPKNDLNALLATLQDFPHKNFVELVNGAYYLFGSGVLFAIGSILQFAVKTLHTEFHNIYNIYKSNKLSSEINDTQRA